MREVGEQHFVRGSDRILGGVCSGLAAGFHIDALWLRVAFVLLAFLQGIGLFIYVVLWLVMPERIEGGAGTRAGFDSMADDLRRVGQELRAQFGGLVGASPRPAAEPSSPAEQPGAPVAPVARYSSAVIPGVVLVVAGAILLGANIGLVSWGVVWPSALIVLGIALLVRTFDKRS
jgi:phage shock protein PspC (stress-responsive transcriptional regulator)